MRIRISLLLCAMGILGLSFCTQAETNGQTKAEETLPPPDNSPVPEYLQYAWGSDFKDENALANRFSPPDGFERISLPKGSFGEWLRFIPLKEGKPDVRLYDKTKKGNQGVHVAVVDIDVGDRDLQQCADATMRLRAEYLFSSDQKDKIQFNFTSGDRIPFSRWSSGEKPLVRGNSVSWSANPSGNSSHESFRKYMDVIFTYAGTASLSKELSPVPNLKDIQAGDVFIQGGFPGHAVTVMDIAANEQTGETLFLLSQSYMPAQEIHILKNPMDPSLSPWYSTRFDGSLRTPEWTFEKENLMRF